MVDTFMAVRKYLVNPAHNTTHHVSMQFYANDELAKCSRSMRSQVVWYT